ncbi:F-box/LRR-repeat protein 2 [Halotydeus destructor]|nr:F-box/LRR-repeat protein 2 [Halotydeus destructor]
MLGSLVDDELQLIFSKLTIGQRWPIQRTSRTWQFLLIRSFIPTTRLTIYKNRQITGKSKGELIDSICLDSALPKHLRGILINLPRIESIDFTTFHEINRDVVDILSSECPGLQSFAVSFPSGLDTLSLNHFTTKLNNISRLELRFSGLTEADMRTLFKNCLKLKELDITGNSAVTGYSFALIESPLQSIQCSRCVRIFAIGLSKLFESSSGTLRELQVDTLGIADEINEKLEAISQFQGLRVLKVRSSFLSTDYNMNGLSRLINLSSLILTEMGPLVTDSGLLALMTNCGQLVNLEVDLCLGRTSGDAVPPPTDLSFARLGQLCPRIESLSLRNVKLLTVKSFTAFSGLHMLKNVELKGMPVDDNSIILVLKGSHSLVNLSLVGCKQLTSSILHASMEAAKSRPRQWLKVKMRSCIGFDVGHALPRNLIFTNQPSFRGTFV